MPAKQVPKVGGHGTGDASMGDRHPDEPEGAEFIDGTLNSDTLPESIDDSFPPNGFRRLSKTWNSFMGHFARDLPPDGHYVDPRERESP